MGSIAEELGDVIYTACVLANSLDIDLDRAMAETLAKVEGRDTLRWQRVLERTADSNATEA